MGGTLTKCVPKKKTNKFKSDETAKTNNKTTICTKHNEVVVKYNSVDNFLSSSERNLLLEVRKEKVQRPVGIPFRKQIRGRSIIRIASWNMKSLTVQKLKNPGVISVICLTVLENNISVLALQEVDDERVANLICAELNNQILKKSKYPNIGPAWTFINSAKPTGRMFRRNEFGIIIYDQSQNISILQNSQLTVNSKTKKETFTRTPFFVNIKINKVVFLIAIFHIKAKGFSEGNNSKTIDEIKDIALLAKALKDTLKPGHKVIFMGDFNESPNSACFQALKDENYLFCIDGLLATNVSQSSVKCYDNIWINKNTEYFYTGLSGVITEGLTHCLIPKDDMMGWGGHVSDHCPVWADFFVTV